jgi:multidrug efflux system outer membrane protein
MMKNTTLQRAGTLAALAAALMLGGCMSFIPAYERPAAPVAPAYAPELTPAGAAGVPAAADIEWQRFFADPRLKRLIELSLQNNRDLRVAILNIEAARATYQVRRADQLPTLGAGVSASREAGTNGGLVNVYAVGLQVTGYELDLFGRVRSLSQAALSQYLATEEARKTTQIALVAGVATTYIGMLADDELLRVTRDALKTREDSFRLTRLRFDNGASSEIDVRQAEQLLETAKATLAQTQRQRALDENALVLLVGQPLPADLPAPLPLAAQQGVTDLPAGLP